MLLRKVGTMRLGDLAYIGGREGAWRVDDVSYHRVVMRHVRTGEALGYSHDTLVIDRESEALLVGWSRRALAGMEIYANGWPERCFRILSKHEEGVVLEDRTTGEIVRLPYPKES